MRTTLWLKSTVLCILLISTVPGWSQQAQLQGRWEGTVQSFQGERQVQATFKKEGENYTGTITGLRGDVPFKEVRVEGSKVTAKAQVDAPQGTIVIDYEFVVQGDNLKGKGEVDFNGQNFTFTYNLKRVSENVAQSQSTSQPATGSPPQQQRVRQEVPQPVQPQSLSYFIGQWTFKWIGRESPLGPGGPKEGTITYTPIIEGRFLESRTAGKSDAGKYAESALIGYHVDKKLLALSEKRMNGVEIFSMGDWTSPISIRFDVAPLKIKGQTMLLKRTISVVAAHSYTVTEDFSLDGEPFQRLGNGTFTKTLQQSSK